MPAPQLERPLELVDMSAPPAQVMEYARVHCGEHPDTRVKAISEFRDLIYERGECSPHRVDDDFLVRFLRARCFIPERAHRLLVNYYKFRKENPTFIDGVYPLDLTKVGDSNIVVVPPYRDQHGRRLLLFRVGAWDPSTVSAEELFQATIFAMEVGVLEPCAQILGGVAIFDLDEVGMQHFWQITPGVAARIVKLLVTSFPVITQAIHIINHSWVFDKIFALFRPLINKEMQKNIFFHGYDVTSLHKHISPNNLPLRYGGVMPEYSYTVWLESVRRDTAILKELHSCGYRVRESALDEDIKEKLKKEGHNIVDDTAFSWALYS